MEMAMIQKILLKLHIIESCPNCDSAWTGGHPNPQDLTTCIVCGRRKDQKITGWVYGSLIDPFCWITHHIVKRNLAKLTKDGKYEEIGKALGQFHENEK